MASHNGRISSRQPLGDKDTDLVLVNDPGAGPGGVPTAGGIADGKTELPPVGRGGDGADTPPVDSSLSPYDNVKASMLTVREPYGLADDPMRLQYPQLFTFLTDRELPGGKRRDVPKITLKATQRGFTATLTCQLLSMAYTAEFRYLADLFAALSTGFTRSGVKWTEVPYGEGHKVRKELERKRLDSQSDEVYDAVKGGRKGPSESKS